MQLWARFQEVRYSPVTLVLVNLVPLACVLFLDWKVFVLVSLYWLENVVIGVINVIKMASLLVLKQDWTAILFIPFFTIHYGGFAAGHGLFIFILFGQDLGQKIKPQDLPGLLAAQPGLLLAAFGLLVHHLASFVLHFLRGGEYQHKNAGQLMGAPYGRVVVLHIVILAGGFWIFKAGEPIWALVLLVVLKTALDLFAHLRSHATAQAVG